MAQASVRTGRGSALAALALLCAFLVTIMLLVGYIAWRTHADTRERITDRVESASQLVANNAGWMVELAQQTLRRVDQTLGDRLISAVPGRATDLGAEIRALPAGADVYVVNANGDTLYATVPNASVVSIEDRSYFQAVRDGAQFYISDLIVSRLTEEQIFVFSRRLERDGQFVGAAMISFDSSILADIWTSLSLEADSAVSLIRNDGALISRYPEPHAPMPLSDSVIFTQLEDDDAGVYESQSVVDDVVRTVAYRRVPGTEIIAVAAVGGLAWQPFWNQVLLLGLLALPVGSALVVASIIIIRLLRRDQHRKEELEAALETNILLFREIHHRVKNNLQSVQSLVRMQDIPLQAKLDLQSRFAAMAAMHEHIYQHDEYLDIIANEFVPAVVQPILATYGDKADVVFDIDAVRIDRDHATPLALLLSELVTNALKYAFPSGRRGVLTISLKSIEGGRSQLTVADDGVGLGEGPAGKSMGLRLIEGIVAQLNGTFTLVTDGGARFDAQIALHQAARTLAAE